MAPKVLPAPRLESRVADVARARGIRNAEELARSSGLHRHTTANWWEKLPRTLQIPTLCKLCKALEAQPGELVVFVDTTIEG